MKNGVPGFRSAHSSMFSNECREAYFPYLLARFSAQGGRAWNRLLCLWNGFRKSQISIHEESSSRIVIPSAGMSLTSVKSVNRLFSSFTFRKLRENRFFRAKLPTSEPLRSRSVVDHTSVFTNCYKSWENHAAEDRRSSLHSVKFPAAPNRWRPCG